MQGVGSLWHPLVERGVTVDELAECPGSAGHIAGASLHASTIAGSDVPGNAQIYLMQVIYSGGYARASTMDRCHTKQSRWPRADHRH